MQVILFSSKAYKTFCASFASKAPHSLAPLIGQVPKASFGKIFLSSFTYFVSPASPPSALKPPMACTADAWEEAVALLISSFKSFSISSLEKTAKSFKTFTSLTFC